MKSILLYLFMLAHCLIIQLPAIVYADINNPQFIVISLDDLWGPVGSGKSAYKHDTGLDFLINLSTEIKAYALSKNPNIAPPNVVFTLYANPGQVELRGYEGGSDNRAKYQALFDLGYDLRSHGHTHQSLTQNGRSGHLEYYSGPYLYTELKGPVDWYRTCIKGCQQGFAFRHGTGLNPAIWALDDYFEMARDIDCYIDGFGPMAGSTKINNDKWPVYDTSNFARNGYKYWYGVPGDHYMERIPSLSTDVPTGLNTWMNVFNASYASTETPHAGVSALFHDFEVSFSGSESIANASSRREILRQFFKKVLVDDNTRYTPGGQYSDVYCITYSQYMEYYWLKNGMPEANFATVQNIIDAGNMQRCKYSVEPSTTVEAEYIYKKSGGSSIAGGWSLSAGSDFMAEVVNFPDEHCTYAIDILAKAVQGSDSSWPVAQVKMSAVTKKLAILSGMSSSEEDKYFSEVGTVTVNTDSYQVFRVTIDFPKHVNNKIVYAMANAVVLKLSNAGNGKRLDIAGGKRVQRVQFCLL